MLSSYDEKHALFQHYLEADKAVLKAGKNFEKSPTEDNLRLYIECANERSSIRQVILENYDNRANMEIIERLSNENHLITIEKLL